MGTEEKGNKDPNKRGLDFFIMVLAASLNGCIYMYCKAEKWNLEESMTVFLYPFFAAALILLNLIIVLIFLICFVNKLVRTHKVYYVFPLLISFSFYLVSNIFFNELKLREYNFKKYQGDREEIIELILQKELMPNENGIVELPEWLKDEEMARGGRVYIVQYQLKTGIFFCAFSGVLDSSAGFVYLLDDTFDADFYNDVTLQNQYQDNWYFCGTG